MSMRWRSAMMAALLFAGAAGSATAQLATGDVALFYRVYDAADGKPDAATLQRDYLDAGSDGLRLYSLSHPVGRPAGAADRPDAGHLRERAQLPAGAGGTGAARAVADRAHDAAVSRHHPSARHHRHRAR